MADVVVEFQSVNMRFGNLQALNDLSFSVQKGEIFGFIGPNGSGKTTTIRLMLDLYPRQGGTIRIFGLDPACALDRLGPCLGVVFDQHGLYEHMSAKEHLFFWGEMFGQRGAALASQCSFLLQMVGLEKRQYDLVRTYSKGMRQRLALARALMNRPRFLILDEPFDGIDVETRHDLLTLIPRLARDETMTVFLTSHNLPDVERLCQRIAIIKRGAVIACDTTDNLRQMAEKSRTLIVTFDDRATEESVRAAIPEGEYVPECRELRLHLQSQGTRLSADEIVRRLVQRGLPVKAVREEKMDLEDIYLRLTVEEE